MEMKEIDALYSSFARRLQHVPTKIHRYLYDQIDWDDQLIGIKGPRGCGKTTLLLQRIKEAFPNRQAVLYVSLDDLWFVNHSLMDAVEYHVQHGGTHLMIDEIHYDKQWQLLLKNIYDQYPALHVVYTGSSMLKIDNGRGDLSRRQMLYSMQGLSFREYLAFEDVVQVAPLSLERLLSEHQSVAEEICEQTTILRHFENYLKAGYFPFYKSVKTGYAERLKEIVNTIIEQDYPEVEDISQSTVRKTRQMLMILAERVPQTPNMSELYAILETDRNQGLKMLNALERGGLLSLLSGEKKNFKGLSRPDKIYLNNTNLMDALTPHANIGTMRETFFLNQVGHAHEVNYPKAGDFLVDRQLLFEVGGRNKSFEQIRDIPDSYLAVDDTEVGHHNRIPLWMFGLLY